MKEKTKKSFVLEVDNIGAIVIMNGRCIDDDRKYFSSPNGDGLKLKTFLSSLKENDKIRISKVKK